MRFKLPGVIVSQPAFVVLPRYPAQETTSGASKIPTIIYYDLNGKVKAVGAEAMEDGVYETAIDLGWEKAEWFVSLVSL